MSACFQTENDLTGEHSQIQKKMIFIESVLTAPYGMVKEVDEKGKFLCAKKQHNQIYFDDKKYEITKVIDVCNSASLKVGGIGQRYTVMINNVITHIFYESETGQWFVEAK